MPTTFDHPQRSVRSSRLNWTYSRERRSLPALAPPEADAWSEPMRRWIDAMIDARMLGADALPVTVQSSSSRRAREAGRELPY